MLFESITIHRIYTGLILVSLAITGCEKKTPTSLAKLTKIRGDDVASIFRSKKPLRVAKTGIPVKIEQVVDSGGTVIGYVEEQRFRVQNDPDTSEVQMFMVYDRRWNRQGLITETGRAYVYEPSGMTKAISSLDFSDGLEIILDLGNGYKLESYDPLNPPKVQKAEADKSAIPTSEAPGETP